MAESVTIARPYAEAVFQLADAKGTLAQWSAMLKRAAVIASDPDMRQAVGNPAISGDQLYGLFASLLGEAMFAESQNLIHVLIENNRLDVLPEISETYEQLKNEREGVVEAQIATAFALEGDALAVLVADLEKRFKRRIQPVVTVEPELIGGIRVQVGDEVIDGSVRGKLASMAVALKS
jgi:F-type H+-transporting ATPase subunit delta